MLVSTMYSVLRIPTPTSCVLLDVLPCASMCTFSLPLCMLKLCLYIHLLCTRKEALDMLVNMLAWVLFA